MNDRQSKPRAAARHFERFAATVTADAPVTVTLEIVRLAQAILDEPASPLSGHALTVLRDIVRAIAWRADPDRPVQVERTLTYLKQLLDRDDLDPLQRAGVLRFVSRNLQMLGRESDAAFVETKVLDLTRSVASTDGGLHSTIAASLAECAVRFQSAGDITEAIRYGTDAVAAWREVASQDVESELRLAAALSNLGAALGDGDRLGEAVVAIREAEAIYRRRAIDDPQAARMLARTLHNLATTLSEIGERPGALEPARQALAIIREVGDDGPDDRRQLCDVLCSLSAFLGEVGDAQGGLEAAEEAIGIAQELVATSSRSVPALAAAMVNLANRYYDLGRFHDAIETGEETLRLYRDLADVNPVFLDDVARTSNNLAAMLDDVGREDDAIDAALAAVGTRRQQLLRQDASSGELAASLVNAANLLGRRGRFTEAVAMAAEAVELRRLKVAEFPLLAPLLARALNAFATLTMEAGDPPRAIDAIGEALAILRDAAAANIVFRADLAAVLNNAAAITAESSTDQALAWSSESTALHRGLYASNTKYAEPMASALDTRSTVLAAAERPEEALACLHEAMDIHRQLAAEPTHGDASLSGALHNFANRLEELGRDEEVLAVAVEIIGLDGRLDATAAAVHRLLEVAQDARPIGADELLPSALHRVADLVAVRLWSHDSPRDRRATLGHLAWLTSAGAVYLAVERSDPWSALRWLDRTTTQNLRSAGALRSPEFSRLAETRPDLAQRLRAALGAASEPNRSGEGIADVIGEIRRSAVGFERFLRPRTSTEIAQDLSGLTAVLACGPLRSVLILVNQSAHAEAMPLPLTLDDIGEPVLQSMHRRPTQAWLGRAKLRDLATSRVIPHMFDQAPTDGLTVVPVGVMNWLPIQAVAADAGLTVQMLPTLSLPAAAPRWSGAPLVVHSNGRGPRLDGARAEAAEVARVVGVEPQYDPIDIVALCDQLGSSSFVHLSCHGVADVSDPDASGLQLGPGPEHLLSIRQLAEHFLDTGAPRFVALSACQTGRTELASPEEASSIASIFLAHGTKAVLSTLWNVNDEVAREFAGRFIRLWSSGIEIGSAYDEAMASLRAIVAVDLHAQSTLDAFQLAGDRRLLWT